MSSYKVNLEIFEGPLDLLLYFIKRDEINIYDIPIANITSEYLEYLSLMKNLDLQIAGDFVEMASTLMQIKSRMLIPRIADAIEDEQIEDPRTELVQRLLEYQKYKELARELNHLEEKNLPYFTRNPNLSHFDHSIAADEVLHKISLFDILSAFKNVMDRIPEEIINHEVKIEEANIQDQSEFIFSHFIHSPRVRFSELTKNISSKIVLIVTLMAILEMMKTQQVYISQDGLFEDFVIEKVE